MYIYIYKNIYIYIYIYIYKSICLYKVPLRAAAPLRKAPPPAQGFSAGSPAHPTDGSLRSSGTSNPPFAVGN